MIILLLIFIIFFPVVTQGATGSAGVDTFYLRPATACTNNGDGLAYNCAASPGASGAWKSAPADSSNIIWTPTTGVDDGDTLYICGAQTEELALTSASIAGSAGNTIKIDFRCPNDPGSITQSTTMPEALVQGNWTNESANIWYLSLASYNVKDPKRLWVNGSELMTASVKAALGTFESSEIATWWFDSGNNRLYYYSSSNPAIGSSSFVSLVTNTDTCGFTVICILGQRDYIDIINPVLLGGNFRTVDIRGARHVSISGTSTDASSCKIGEMGTYGIEINDSTFDGNGTPADDITISQCTIAIKVPSNIKLCNWWCYSYDGIYLGSGILNSKITGNVFIDWWHNAMTIESRFGTGVTTGNVFKNNTVIFTSQSGYGRAFGIDGSADGKATNNWFISNITTGQPTQSQVNGNGNFIIGNLWDKAQTSTVIGKAPYSAYIDFYGYAGVTHDNTIANNTFANNPFTPCVTFTSDFLTPTISGNILQNNIFYECGGTSNSSFLNVALAIPTAGNVGNQIIKNNAFYSSKTTSTILYKGSGTTTVSAFQSACSGDTCSGNVSTDPQFVDSISNYRLKAGSPSRRVGDFYSGCIDVRGRVCNQPPDRGAYQMTSGDPATARSVR